MLTRPKIEPKIARALLNVDVCWNSESTSADSMFHNSIVLMMFAKISFPLVSSNRESNSSRLIELRSIARYDLTANSYVGASKHPLVSLALDLLM